MTGTEDFSVSVTLKATAGGAAAFPDEGTSGALFIRSNQLVSPYTGPSAFIYSNGDVKFRLRGDDVCTATGVVSDWTVQTTLLFKRAGNTLVITKDGNLEAAEECTMAKVTSARLERLVYTVLRHASAPLLCSSLT